MQVGGLTGAVMIDVSESFALSSGANSSELCEFKDDILPVLLCLEDACQITVVSLSTFYFHFEESSAADHQYAVYLNSTTSLPDLNFLNSHLFIYKLVLCSKFSTKTVMRH